MEIQVRDTTRGGGEGISPDQFKAIIALLEQPTMEKAAKAAKVNKATIYQWLRRDTAFREAYREARRETFSLTVARLQAAASAAVDALVDIVENPKHQAASRVGAAKAILDYSVRSVEVEDLAARIEALEGDIDPKTRKEES